MRAEDERASWLELSASALRTNLATFREVLDGRARLGVVLKADAYGHGLVELLPVVHGGADVLYVIRPADALTIRAWERQTGVEAKPVLVLGAAGPEEAVALARAGVEVVLGDGGWRAWEAAVISADAPRLQVHVHVDSGLGREGFAPEAIGEALAGWTGRGLEVVGALTHFANTEDVTEQGYALQQLRQFDAGVAALREVVGDRPLVAHTAASAAALVLPASRRDVVRVGIALYGLWPSRETRLSSAVVHARLPTLRPVLSWKVMSQHIKWLPAGAYVGYGCTHRCRDATRVAVLPVGYFDGYPRALSGRAHVLVAGRRCPVLGRVMMNHLIIDITGVPEGDGPVPATLLGRDGDEEVSADDLAGWGGTINYEIVARLGSHLARRWAADDGP